MAASLQQVLRSRMRRALVCKADVGCLGDVLRLAVEFGGEAAQGVPVKAFNDHGDLRRTRPPPRRAAQHGVAHLLKGGFCQQSAGQVVVGLLIREDGPQAVAVTDFPKRRRAARVMSGVRSEEHTSELQSLMRISYAVFCLKKKTNYTYIYKYYTNTDNVHNITTSRT